MSNIRFVRDDSSSHYGLTFNGLLQVAFIVLKLCNVIKWRWLWVLAPTWIPLGIVLLFLLIALGVSVWAERKN